MSFTRLKMRQLTLLLKIAETGSLRKAAEQIHLSQPAATRLLRELEQAMGLELFERSHLGMQLTQAGEIMVDHARVLLSAMSEAFTHVEEVAAGRVGSLKLGVFGGADPRCIASCALQLKQRFPGIKVTIKEAPLEMLLSALREGDLDMIVSRTNEVDPSGPLQQEVLYSERFVLACGVQSALAAQENIVAADLLDKTWLIPPSETLVRQHVDAYFLRNYGRAPANTIESASLLANIALLNCGDVVGVVAGQLAVFLKDQNLLKELPIKIDGFSRPVVLITSRAHAPKPQREYMTQFIREYARSEFQAL